MSQAQPISPEHLQIALAAIQLRDETRLRPSHVTIKQAAEMLGRSQPFISGLVKRGIIKTNELGTIPITEVDRMVHVRKERGRAA